MHPGVADEYKPGWSHTLDTLWDNQTAGSAAAGAQQRQVFDKYLDYSILASSSDSVGDLQFDFAIPNLVGPVGSFNVSGIWIYVPPEFQFLAPTVRESVWTDFTNDNQFLAWRVEDQYDPVAPLWTRIAIGSDGGWNVTAGNYHVRLFNLRAPSTAGLYHFKIYWHDSDGVTRSIGAGNYPFVIVKSELNPAWVEVTVRTHLATARPWVSGVVRADGTTPEGRSVTGVAYWGPMEFVQNNLVPGAVGALYTTYLFGLAAGTYTLTAEASGFNPTTTARFTLDPGQSWHIDIVIFDSPDVCVTIWSKHGTGAIPWHNLWQLPYGTNSPYDLDTNATWRDILIELYDGEGNFIGFWASNVLGTVGVAPDPGPSPAWQHGLGATKTIAVWGNKLIGLHDDEAPWPNRTSYYACLTDNTDVPSISLSVVRRGYPSTHWDGHVPWHAADYIAGWPNGQYTVEAFVTGYIMDEADAYQRTFSMVGSNYNLQFDLRRSNWIEVTLHHQDWMPVAGFPLSGPTTVTLTAEDAAGNERGVMAFLATTAMSADGDLDGADGSNYYNAGPGPAVDVYNGGLVIEGWNAVFPNVGDRSAARDINKKDYGLNPTASTHSAGQVTLGGNPYTIRLYMADMGIPYWPDLDANGFPAWNATGWYTILGGDPQTSVYLCNTPVPLSFIIVNARIWISLRSVDFEVPAHSRPWTFPGSEIYVDFVNSAGDVVDSLDPTIYGLFQDPGWLNITYNQNTPAGTRAWWQILGVDYTPATGDYAGHGWGWSPYDVDNLNPAGMHEHLGVWYFGTDYCSPTINGGFAIYRALIDKRSTRLPADQYTFNAYTHGYVMRRSYSMWIPTSGAADIEADLIQGGQIRVTMDFYHEGIATGFHGFIYAEVFNSEGTLVGASIYGQAQPNVFTRLGHGGAYLEYAGWPYRAGAANLDWMVVQGPAQGTGLNFWNGTTAPWQLNSPNYQAEDGHYLQNCDAFPSCSYSQRAYYAWLFHTNGWPPLAPAPVVGFPNATWADWMGWAPPYYTVNQDWWFPGNRVDMDPGTGQSFDIYGFYQYYGNAMRTWAGGWPTNDATGQMDYGLKGSVDIPGWEGSGGGLYSVKVWAFDPRGPNNATELAGWTDDWRMYSMGWPLENIEVPWGGAVELYVAMNNMASLRGTVRWFDMFGNLRALPWAQVSASPGPSTDSVPAYSAGFGGAGAGTSDPSGGFIMWLPAGTHAISVSTSEAPGVWSSSSPTVNAEYTVVVSPGWVGGSDSQLDTTGLPVPEIPSALLPLGLFAALAASAWLLRKRTINTPILLK